MPDGMIAHYRLGGEIGAGGMGVVYRAHDPRLERDVALKVLPADTLHDQTARARLLREARLAATLNHPNICTVHEVGEDAGRVFIAMEMVEGRPLSERIAERGLGAGLPTESVARYGAQVAAALAHAHERHVIHRDLKSSNVVVLADGRVKVLDFGLARRLWEGPDQAARAPQVTLTETGTLVGTPHYLAPEVLRGNKADERSDLWALGVLLHEMACGALPFVGRTGFELAAAILNDPPTPPPARIPAGLRAVMARCLAKEQGERYQRASEVQAALEAIGSAASEAPGRTPDTGRRRRMATFAGWAGLVLLVGAGWFARRSSTPRPQPAERQLTTNPVGLPLSHATISPDGKSLLYADSTGMYLKDIASGEIHTVPPPPGIRFSLRSLGWFPDGTRLILASGSEKDSAAAGVWQVSLMGWAWRRLAPQGRLAVVSPDGARIAFARGDSAIWVMGADGQDAIQAHPLGRRGVVWDLAWAPDGARIAYLRYQLRGDRPELSIETVDPARHDVSLIVKDPRLMKRFGGSLAWSWMRDGRILYALSDSLLSRAVTLWQVSVGPRDGRPRGKPKPYARSSTPLQAISASADGRREVVLRSIDQMDVHVADLEAGATRLLAPRRLTLDDRDDWLGSWSLSGQSVLFTSDRQGLRAVFRQRLDRSTPEVVASATNAPGPPGETADGRWILFHYRPPGAPGGTGRIMRTAGVGNPAETVLEYSRPTTLRCPSRPGAECVMCENDSAGSVFSILDPGRGRGRELARVAAGRAGHCSWALSPDGARLALAFPDFGDSIQVMDLDIRRTTVIRLRFAVASRLGGAIQYLSFAGSGERDGMITSGYTHIFHVDPAGRVIPLHQVAPWLGIPQISPNGKQLAWQQMNSAANAWLWETR